MDQTGVNVARDKSPAGGQGALEYDEMLIYTPLIHDSPSKEI